MKGLSMPITILGVVIVVVFAVLILMVISGRVAGSAENVSLSGIGARQCEIQCSYNPAGTCTVNGVSQGDCTTLAKTYQWSGFSAGGLGGTSIQTVSTGTLAASQSTTLTTTSGYTITATADSTGTTVTLTISPCTNTASGACSKSGKSGDTVYFDTDGDGKNDVEATIS